MQITSGESKRYPPLLPEELRRADVSGSVRGAEGVSEDPCERLGEHDGRGAVQGEKEVSLPGFLSCTIDSVETGGRGWKTRGGRGTWDVGHGRG